MVWGGAAFFGIVLGFDLESTVGGACEFVLCLLPTRVLVSVWAPAVAPCWPAFGLITPATLVAAESSASFGKATSFIG